MNVLRKQYYQSTSEGNFPKNKNVSVFNYSPIPSPPPSPLILVVDIVDISFLINML